MRNSTAQINRTELLAPGGSMESIRAAVNAGADAVYAAGTRFGARAYANNPEPEQLLEAIDLCHIHGVKLYLTVNTLMKERELKEDLCSFLQPYYERGVDAVLVQDLGAARVIRARFPDLPLHASTQMSVQSPDGARLARHLGITRIVPARELSLSEIRKIRQETDMEIECFIHGALCFSYSGQCLMSSLIGGRSGNRGRCAQPCRKEYLLTDAKGRAMSRENAGYLLNLKDIAALDLIPDLIEAGIASFKIEGRMKSDLYTAGVTGIYRKYIDLYEREGREGFRVEESDREMLCALFQKRGYSKGYYYIGSSPKMMALRMDPGAKNIRSLFLEEEIREKYLVREKQEKIKGLFILKAGREAILEVSPAGPEGQGPDRGSEADGSSCRKNGLKSQGSGLVFRAVGQTAQKALSHAVTEEQIERQLRKTGDTHFVFDDLQIELEDNLFIPMGAVNALRREALEGLARAVLLQGRRKADSVDAYDAEQKLEQAALLKDKWKACGMDGEKRQDDAGEELKTLFTAAVSRPEQLETVLLYPEVGRIYLDCVTFMDEAAAGGDRHGKGREAEKRGKPGIDSSGGKNPDLPGSLDLKRQQIRRTIRRVKEAGKECYLALPRTWRAQVRERFYALFPEEILRLADGLLLRCLDQAGAFAGEIGADAAGKALYPCQIMSDENIYAWNSKTVQTLSGLGIRQVTLPAELTAAELSDFTKAGHDDVYKLPVFELPVYGYQVSMVTAQCLRKNTKGCDHTPSLMFLQDERHARFPVRNRCGICANEIYNSAVLDLTDLQDEAKRCGASLLRLSFTIEDTAQTKAVLDRVISSVSAAEGSNFTRGHFRRGVE